MWRVVAVVCAVLATACSAQDSVSQVGPDDASSAAPPSEAAADAAPRISDAGPPAAKFEIGLPIRPEDSRQNAFGINSFGIHIGDHGLDGHPGWDFEYAVGAPVLAVADGRVQSVLPSEGGTSWGLQIEHSVGGRTAYRSICGVGTLAPGVAPGAAVTNGQTLGTVASFTRTIGTVTVTYGFTHFQFDDFSKNAGLTNPNAVSPELHLSSGARSALVPIWQSSTYYQEFVEPYLTNPRTATFPMTRTWTLDTGSQATSIDFTRADGFANTFGYLMRNAAKAIVETGTVELNPLVKPYSQLDFIPAGSTQRRKGVYGIVDGAMTLDYGPIGGARPTSLGAASQYRTL